MATQVSTSLLSSVAMTDAVISNPKSSGFPLFAKLPLELQLKIMALTVGGPRIIKLRLKTDSSGTWGVVGSMPPPTILQINKYWREEYGKFYKLAFKPHIGLPALTRFDFGRDTLYFDPKFDEDFSVWDLITRIQQPDLQLVQTLAAHTLALELCNETYICEILAHFGNIRTLNVIHDEYRDPIVEIGMDEKARCQELTMIDVWDTTEKLSRMEQWIADVHGATIDQPRASFNAGGHFKPKKSEVKHARSVEIEAGRVEHFVMPAFKQKVMVSMTVKKKLEQIEAGCQSLMVYQRHRWRCPWDGWQWRVLAGKDGDSDASTISYWDPKYDVVDPSKNSEDEAVDGDEGYDADEEDTD